MLTIEEIRERYGVDIGQRQLDEFRETQRRAEGPPFRMTVEMPPPDLPSDEEEAEVLAKVLRAQTREDAQREAGEIWITQPHDDAATGYAVWSANWGCVHSFRVDKESAEHVRPGKNGRRF